MRICLTFEEHSYPLRRSGMAAVKVNARWYPPELCFTASHQAYRRQLPPKLNSILVQRASRCAPLAKRDVVSGLHCIDNRPHSEGDEYQTFTVDPKMLCIPYQRLHGPALFYGP